MNFGRGKHRWGEAPRNYYFPSFELMTYGLNFYLQLYNIHNAPELSVVLRLMVLFLFKIVRPKQEHVKHKVTIPRQVCSLISVCKIE
jgi:hypothetical protein